jgi:hypothetical protein
MLLERCEGEKLNDPFKALPPGESWVGLKLKTEAHSCE